MKTQTKLLTALAISGLFFSLTPRANADAWNKKTKLTVNKTIEVPGAVLQPGKYVVKLVDSQSNRHIVRFLNEREDHVFSTVIAIPNTRLEPTGDTEFSWYETPAGEPPALRAWFYPGDNFGQEFVYPERQGRELAKRISTEVPTMKPEETAALQKQPAGQKQETATRSEPAVVAQAKEPKQPEPIRQQPTVSQKPAQQQQMARNERPSPASSGMTENQSLPQTAGPAPLLALLGLLSLGSAATLRKVRKD